MFILFWILLIKMSPTFFLLSMNIYQYFVKLDFGLYRTEFNIVRLRMFTVVWGFEIAPIKINRSPMFLAVMVI